MAASVDIVPFSESEPALVKKVKGFCKTFRRKRIICSQNMGTPETALPSNVKIAYDCTGIDDWSRYADDPDGLMNRRNVSREERRRLFEASKLLASVPQSTRNFKPFIQEQEERPPRLWGIKSSMLAVASSRSWDKLYLLGMGIFLLAVPAVIEDDFGLGCRKSDGHLPLGVSCWWLWQPLSLMSASTLPPILGAIMFRLVAFNYVKAHESTSCWSFFFVLALKACGSERLCVALRARRITNSARVAPSNDEESTPSDSTHQSRATKARNTDVLVMLTKPIGSMLMRMSAKRHAKRRTSHDDVHKIAGAMRALGRDDNKFLEWRCVVCYRENRQPLRKQPAIWMRTVIHRIPRDGDEDRICASFKAERYRPRCACCATPIDYKVRASNKDKFGAPTKDAIRAVALLNTERVAARKFAAEQRQRKLREEQRRRERRLLLAYSPEPGGDLEWSGNFSVPAPAPLDEENPGTAADLRSVARTVPDQEAVQRRKWPKLKVVAKRVHYLLLLRSRTKANSRSASSHLLFNNWEFERKVKEFRAIPERRVLKPGARYQLGDKVESYQHFPTWYPATVIAKNDNGSYVLRFDNGEVAQAVGAKLIRYRVTLPVSALHRCFSGALLTLVVAWPAWIASHAANVQKNDRALLLYPLGAFSFFVTVAIALDFALIYVREGHGAGISFVCKLAAFWSGPPFLLLLLVVLSAFQSVDSYVILVIFVIFWLDATLVVSALKPVCVYLSAAATVPVISFATLFTLWHSSQLAIFRGTLGPFLNGRLYIVFVPAYVVYYQACWLHANLPYLWDATFFDPASCQSPSLSSSGSGGEGKILNASHAEAHSAT